MSVRYRHEICPDDAMNQGKLFWPASNAQEMSGDMRYPTMWYVRPAQPQISLCIRAVCSEPLLVACIFYDYKATGRTEFGVSKLKGGCTGLSKSTHIEMPHCWKSRIMAN